MVFLMIPITLGLKWFFLPAINFHSTGFYWFCFFIGAIATVLLGLVEGVAEEQGEGSTLPYLFSGIAGGLTVIVFLVGMIVPITASKMFNADKYHNLLEITQAQESDFQTDIPTVEDASKIPMVDMNTAQMYGNRSLGDSLGVDKVSQFKINNEYNLVLYNGKQYRLSPLEYNGFWKYRKNKNSGIPGYVLVDNITGDTEVVLLEEGMKYSPSAHFKNKLSRHLRNNYPTYIFDKTHFEIDDEGIPYFVAPVLTAKVSVVGGKVVTSVVIVNAVSGKCEEYSLKEIPDWVDHVYSLSYLMDLTSIHYKYVNGYWNANFSESGVKKLSYNYKDSTFAGYNSVIANRNEKDSVFFFTGVTSSVKTDESNLGFVLANTRTGEVIYYPISGAEESSAQGAAEGPVQNFNYKATYPVILNVEGVPTYFMSLLDEQGIIKKYAFVKVKDFKIAIVEDTLDEVVEKYKLKTKPNEEITEEEVLLTKSGVVSKIYQAMIEGYSYYYIEFENDENLYKTSIVKNDRLVKLEAGMNVEIGYKETMDQVCIVTSIKIG